MLCIDAYPHSPWPASVDDTVMVTAPPVRYVALAWMYWRWVQEAARDEATGNE